MNNKILIADDDPDVCNSLAILLREEGYCVDEVTDGGQAKSFIKKNKYDVCLFDYKIKGLRGVDLLKIAKEANSQCSVFIISGMLDIDELCSEEKKSGLLADIIRKPFDVEVLLQKIKSVI